MSLAFFLSTMGAYVPPVSVFYRPSSDVSSSGIFNITGGAGTRWSAIDEASADDADYVYSFNTGAGSFVVGMTGSTISATGGAILRARGKWVTGGTGAMTVSLGGTTYISVSLTKAGFVTYEATLTKAQADALIAGAITCTFAFNGRCQLSWAELEFLGE